MTRLIPLSAASNSTYLTSGRAPHTITLYGWKATAAVCAPMLGAAALLLASCSTAQVQTAQKDITTACSDWNSAVNLAAPFALVPSVATTEAYVADLCTTEPLLASAGAAQISWLETSVSNLKAVTPTK